MIGKIVRMDCFTAPSAWCEAGGRVLSEGYMSVRWRHKCKWCVGDGLKRYTLCLSHITHQIRCPVPGRWIVQGDLGDCFLTMWLNTFGIGIIHLWSNTSVETWEMEVIAYLIVRSIPFSNGWWTHVQEKRNYRRVGWIRARGQNSTPILRPIVVYSLKAVWTIFGHTEQQWMKHELNTDWMLLFTSHKCVVRMTKWANKCVVVGKQDNIWF